MFYSTYTTGFGNIAIATDGKAITSVKLETHCNLQSEKTPHPLLDQAASQLREFFAGTRQQFDLPLNPAGTAFQKSVWNALLTIPYGETRSYAQMAQFLEKPTASRAVGSANGKNPIWFIIPCHRVIAASGALSGYAGGIEIKQRLLELEGRVPLG